MPIVGIERVRSNLNAFLNRARHDKTEAAIYTILSQGIAMSDMMVPNVTGNLENSHYAPIVQQTASGAVGFVGYRAEYAGFVHAAPGKLAGEPRPKKIGGLYWDPDGEPRFLEKGFDLIKPSIPSILKAVYRV